MEIIGVEEELHTSLSGLTNAVKWLRGILLAHPLLLAQALGERRVLGETIAKQSECGRVRR